MLPNHDNGSTPGGPLNNPPSADKAIPRLRTPFLPIFPFLSLFLLGDLECRPARKSIVRRCQLASFCDGQLQDERLWNPALLAALFPCWFPSCLSLTSPASLDNSPLGIILPVFPFSFWLSLLLLPPHVLFLAGPHQPLWTRWQLFWQIDSHLTLTCDPCYGRTSSPILPDQF